MADESEQPEIIPKPPSHPITTTLLVTSFFGTILCIGFVWAELFGDYLHGAKSPVEAGMDQHTWKEIKEAQGPIDHYGQDFKIDGKPEKLDKEMIYSVKKELKLLEQQSASDTSSGGDAPK